ncbi:MAG TPA: PaaI family thioesterase [Burkholderiales bacterium]|nr:PaaI family thioesterase [Burkholderiales bacterium]
MSDIPEGYRTIERASPFVELIGPVYERRRGERVSIGLRIERKHTNRRGVCHGGVLATLADIALGYAMLGQAGAKGGFVTANLAIDYAGAAKLGDWLHSEVEVQRMGSRLAFANGYLVRGETRIVRASAIFALPGRPAG